MSGISLQRSADKARVVLESHLTRSQVQVLQPILSREMESGAVDFEFECAQLSRVDGAGVALLTALEASLKGKGQVRLTHANSGLLELMSQLHLTARLHVATEGEVPHG